MQQIFCRISSRCRGAGAWMQHIVGWMHLLKLPLLCKGNATPHQALLSGAPVQLYLGLDTLERSLCFNRKGVFPASCWAGLNDRTFGTQHGCTK